MCNIILRFMKLIRKVDWLSLRFATFWNRIETFFVFAFCFSHVRRGRPISTYLCCFKSVKHEQCFLRCWIGVVHKRLWIHMALLIHFVVLFRVDVVVGLVFKRVLFPLLLFVRRLCLFEQFKKMSIFLVDSGLFLDSAVNVVAYLEGRLGVWRFGGSSLHDGEHVVEEVLVGNKDVSVAEPLVGGQRPVFEMGVDLGGNIVDWSLDFGYAFEQIGVLLLFPEIKQLTWGCMWGFSGFLKNSLI